MTGSELQAFRDSPHAAAAIALRAGMTPPRTRRSKLRAWTNTFPSSRKRRAANTAAARSSPMKNMAPAGRAHAIKDVGVIGAGIVGLAHAWSAARRGHRVTVFERSKAASGASIRNFGMIWPIGQPAGEPHAIALRSREAWLELARDAGIWVNPCGSIHLAHRDDEWTVLEEFTQAAPGLGYSCELLTREDVLRRTAAANPDHLLGGLFSASELGVNPDEAVRALPRWLASHQNVLVRIRNNDHNGRCPVGCGAPTAGNGLSTARSSAVAPTSRRCSQRSYRGAGIRSASSRCRRRSRSRKIGRLGPHLASGLTLRHYPNFARHASLDVLRRRIADEAPELDRYGIHVMASQNDAGEVILGDSHEYDAAIEPFRQVPD